MTSQRSTEIKVGLVSIIAIILFIVGISLGSGVSVSTDIRTIKMRFPNSAGIKPTAPVTVNGVRRGKVSSITNDNGSVLIEAEIEGIKDLKSDAAAKIMVLEITGGKKIEIEPGDSNKPFDLTMEIPGKTAGDMGEMLAMAADLGEDAALLVKRVDTLLATANDILSDKKMISQIKETVELANDMAHSLNSLMKINSPAINSAIRNVNDLTSDLKSAVLKNEPKVDTLMSQLKIALENVNGLLNNAKNSVKDVDQIIADFSEMSKELKTGKGVISKLIYDDKLGKELEATFHNLKQLVDFIEKYGINVNVELGHAKRKKK